MLTADFCPIVVIPTIKNGDSGIRFLHRNDQIDITSDENSILWEILGQCNGYNQISDIAEKSGVPVRIVQHIIEELIELEIVVDSRKQYQHFHRISNYPTGFGRNMSQEELKEYTSSPRAHVKTGKSIIFRKVDSSLNPILKKRRSCRGFSDKQLHLDTIGSICYYGYSICNHHVPSGGALYPLKLYVIVEYDQIDLRAGYYEYDPEKDMLIQFCNLVDIEQLKHCFNAEEIAFGAKVQIIIAADLNRQTHKYGNRGYRLTLLEAGHTAENICLFCAEQGLGSCELGGVLDEPLRRELQLNDEIYPIVAIAVGYNDSVPRENFDEIGFLEKNASWLGLDYNLCKATTFNDNCSFFGASVKYGDNDNDIAGATSASYSHAVFKANIEAYERKASGFSRVDFEGTARQLEESGKLWANPQLFVPLTSTQAKNCGVVPFSTELDIQWTKGFSIQQHDDIYVPTDIVYYGHKFGRNPIYVGNSSGVAAHTDMSSAKKLALAELIERDAIMRCWFYHISPPVLSTVALPLHVRRRAEHWLNVGRRVVVMDMPSPYAKVILIAIVSDEYPCFVCGASATLNNSDEAFIRAVNKALQEAELCLYSCLKYPRQNKIEPKSVITPSDHGRLYYYSDYINKLEWLWNGEIHDKPSGLQMQNFEKLAHHLDVIEVILSKKNDPIHVVRMLSSKLVPISFGYYNSHFSHPALQGKCDENCFMLPHFFA